MISMQWQLGILGTISAFAHGHRKTKKNLRRCGRSQDLPDPALQTAVRLLIIHPPNFSLNLALKKPKLVAESCKFTKYLIKNCIRLYSNYFVNTIGTCTQEFRKIFMFSFDYIKVVVLDSHIERPDNLFIVHFTCPYWVR